ncbi:hypothetical protein ACP6NF_03350 [Alcaligenes faecalis]|uniref:hypothetical protein n=1 Tax=Alcaligenes faecalis TaxID=511 RepID=UPI003F7C4C53
MSKETQTMVPENAEPVYQLWSDEGFGGWTDTDKATYCWWLDSKNPPRMRKLYTAPVATQPDVTQQTLDDVMAGIPARDAEIEALRKEIEALQAAQLQPYSLDLDPAGIRALTADAISGALALGFQGVNPPPNNEHWLAPFWEIGRESAAQVRQPVSGADGLPQAMLPARPTPEASNTFGLGLDGYTGAQMLTYGRACAEAQRKADSQAKLSGNTGELAREFANRLNQTLKSLSPKYFNGFNVRTAIQDTVDSFTRIGHDELAKLTKSSSQQDADKVDAALAGMVHAMFRSGNSVPVTRITIDRKQYDAAIDAARKELA